MCNQLNGNCPDLPFAFTAMTLLIGCQEEHLASQK